MRLTILICLMFLSGCGAPTVTRAVGGRIFEGRYISENAYTLYAIGAEAEAHGDLANALAAYELASDWDGESADIWTRIGVVRCRIQKRGWDDAFKRARDLDPEYEPAFREEARCDLAAGRVREAHERIERAILLDPDRDDSILLRAEILRKLGRTEDARFSLRALTIRHPRSVDGWRALYAFSLQERDFAAAEQAARRVRELSPRQRDALQRRLPALLPLEELDAALRVGELRRARRLALEAKVPPAEVAVRAAALGRLREAHDQAELVAGADPSSASALVALAVAADLAGDAENLARACNALIATRAGNVGAFTPPSTLARLLLAELLARRVSRDAALVWLGPTPPEAATGDLLEQRVAERVRTQLASSAP